MEFLISHQILVSHWGDLQSTTNLNIETYFISHFQHKVQILFTFVMDLEICVYRLNIFSR